MKTSKSTKTKSPKRAPTTATLEKRQQRTERKAYEVYAALCRRFDRLGIEVDSPCTSAPPLPPRLALDDLVLDASAGARAAAEDDLEEYLRADLLSDAERAAVMVEIFAAALFFAEDTFERLHGGGRDEQADRATKAKATLTQARRLRVVPKAGGVRS